ncbi:hypothetical protein DFJ74DRAFT_457256 [Hyaloraphidium curvatum]|nr:hypothetical protein DFJ74DRAFT_457256 [Hyaloraphidium curvatum]
MSSPLPDAYRRIELVELGRDFRRATRLTTGRTSDLLHDLARRPDAVLLRTAFVGIQASEVLFASGGYNPGRKPPYGAGIECVGEVVRAGPAAEKAGFARGVKVAALNAPGGCHAEFVLLPMTNCFIVGGPGDAADPRMLAAAVSGLTASMALEKTARMKVCRSSVLAKYVDKALVAADDEPQTVLVTAAAGGTGLFATQLAKLAGNRVVATCGSEDKRAMLKRWGVDVVVNYKTEDLRKVLKQSCPDGVDITYECVGGSLLLASAIGSAKGGHILLIGSVQDYKDDSKSVSSGGGALVMDVAMATLKPVFPILFSRSVSITGWLLSPFLYDKQGRITPSALAHIDMFASLIRDGKLEVPIDNDGGRLAGLERVPDAVEYLHAGKNVGKVALKL